MVYTWPILDLPVQEANNLSRVNEHHWLFYLDLLSLSSLLVKHKRSFLTSELEKNRVSIFWKGFNNREEIQRLFCWSLYEKLKARTRRLWPKSMNLGFSVCNAFSKNLVRFSSLYLVLLVCCFIVKVFLTCLNKTKVATSQIEFDWWCQQFVASQWLIGWLASYPAEKGLWTSRWQVTRNCKRKSEFLNDSSRLQNTPASLFINKSAFEWDFLYLRPSPFLSFAVKYSWKVSERMPGSWLWNVQLIK